MSKIDAKIDKNWFDSLLFPHAETVVHQHNAKRKFRGQIHSKITKRHDRSAIISFTRFLYTSDLWWMFVRDQIMSAQSNLGANDACALVNYEFWFITTQIMYVLVCVSELHHHLF